ncbi:cupin domain-containing protein [Novosphingobium sp. BL-8H]|uniref:cupin domain-containing protein n=1 Tax=Novosphingobium sp. BL-8H TaxID=3127640 RepID=UPI0037570080
MIRNAANSEHYTWGADCDGWILAPSPEMMVIEERMPSGTAETRHFHTRARQFFYVLAGELVMEIEGQRHVLPAMSGIEVVPGKVHQARNDSSAEVRFLVTSSPSTRGDRTNLS